MMLTTSEAAAPLMVAPAAGKVMEEEELQQGEEGRNKDHCPAPTNSSAAAAVNEDEDSQRLCDINARDSAGATYPITATDSRSRTAEVTSSRPPTFLPVGEDSVGTAPAVVENGAANSTLAVKAGYLDDTEAGSGSASGDDEDDDLWLSPTAHSARSVDSGGSEFNWDEDAKPSELLSPALRGVHATAVEVMRRSTRMLETFGFFDEEVSKATKGAEDDDGMFEEEQSLEKKAASLHQSLTDVSVDDINITAGLGDADGEDADDKENDVGHVTDNAGAAGKQATSPAEAAAAAWGGQEHTPRVAHGIGARGVGSGGKGDRGFSSAGGGARASQERARGDYSDGDGDGDKEVDETSKLVFRSVARRPLKEMLRLEPVVEADGFVPVVRLEHLPPFTEQWVPEALTPQLLSQVFSGLVPIASRQGQREPVCTYMLECCVRPEVDGNRMLHIVSTVASEHGLELVRKRGAQVLYGVAPPFDSGGSWQQLSAARRRSSSQASASSHHKSTPQKPPSTTNNSPHSTSPPPRRRSPSKKPAIGATVLLPAEGFAVAPPPRLAVPLMDDIVLTPGMGGVEEAEEGGMNSPASTASEGGEGGDGEEAGTGGETPELHGWKGAGGAGWGPWSHVDMQLVVGQASKHRVLLIRFVTARPASCREAFRVAATAAEIGQPLAIAPAAEAFVSSARSALRERGVSLEALEACPPGEGPVELDPQFLGQVEGMCQWDMVASLKEAGQSLDEHARNEELRGVVVTRLLEEMFELCELPMLPPPPQLVLAVPRPNDILPTRVESMPELTKEDEIELAHHLFASEASRVMAAVLARCIRFTERCDEQMTARMQRKNRQVMQRISRSQLYQRELFQALRDGQQAVRRTRMAAVFHRHMEKRAEVGIDPLIETPLYYCSIIANRRPGHLYLTYWHLCVVTRYPGFSPNIFVMALEDVDAVERIKFFVGYGIQVRRRLSPFTSPPPYLWRAPSSSAPMSPSPSATSRADSWAATPAAAAQDIAARKARPPVISFSTTGVSTGELRELIVALVRVHREPVTSPTGETRVQAAAAEARAAKAVGAAAGRL